MVFRIVGLREVALQIMAVLQKRQPECVEYDPTAPQSAKKMLPSFADGILRIGMMQDPHRHQLDVL